MTIVNNLKGYRYVYSSAAKKDLRYINKKDVLKIDRKLQDLVSGSLDLDIKKLSGSGVVRYRLRVGCYRIVYEIYEDKIVVIVVGVQHRKEIYRIQKR